MTSSTCSYINQWFTFTYKQNQTTNLICSCTDNSYVHKWFKTRGHTALQNVLSKNDLDDFLTALNESSNAVPDNFNTYFSEDPEYYISDKKRKLVYIEQVKEQMRTLFDKLFDLQ